ncbi:hypothetical protein ACHAXA_008132 [Cyclostephanos tholiformis]|uniref:Uncharacterized protein n=1 Tax=Cyclostephanos tholiformis TaxID=382380 RepID=A0ABD3SEM7_9STRA
MVEDRNAPPIGSKVRVTSKIAIDRPGPKRRGDGVTLTFARRSIVATLPDDDGRVSLVQDDLSPIPLTREGRFLIAPMFESAGVQVDECEADASDLLPLLAFEDHRDCGDDIADYKDYGDKLLSLFDYTCAISYYEAALNLISTKIEVGGTVIVRRKGHCVIAEVDFIENDEAGNKLYDVTFPSGEDDATITRKEILLAVWTKDVLNLQIKILLNLSRCLLKLADVDVSRGNSDLSGKTMSTAKSSRQDRYRQATVLGCSIAISICEHRTSESIDELAFELYSLREKARIVRSRAFLALRKLPNAVVDVKKVLIQNATNREAKVLLSKIKAAEAYAKLTDKRLSKEFCRWVKTATDSSNGAEVLGRVDDLI